MRNGTREYNRDLLNAIVAFKHPSLQNEFQFLNEILVALIFMLAYKVRNKYNKIIVVTSIWRDDPQSTHYELRGIDLRVSNLPEKAIEFIISYIKTKWEDKVHVIRHNSGQGDHIHINLNKIYCNPLPDYILNNIKRLKGQND